jgi:3'-phosphoadenosine 5'-phosphosulfate sulfotransferase (PAPS reductase)/FAD synthetase
VTPQEVLAQAVERHHPRLVMACSFQKEESVLIDMLMRIEPSARVFTIDTGVLFPETYEVWRKVEDRYGLKVEVVDATPPNGTPWSASNCCGVRKVDALEQALAGTSAWITGIRREQSPTRADAQAVECRRCVDLRPRARSPVPSPARPGLRVDRLRSLHTARQRPRGPLGGAGQDRVRSARMTPLL